MSTSILLAWGGLVMLGVPGCYAAIGGDPTATGFAAVVGAVLFAAGCVRDAIEANRRP